MEDMFTENTNTTWILTIDNYAKDGRRGEVGLLSSFLT